MTPASSLQIKDYLLGRFTAEEETRLEELYFADPELVGELWAIFAELGEQYLQGELAESERAQFERRLQQSPVLREMFENEKALHRYAPEAIAAQAPSRPAAAIPTRSRWSEWFRVRPVRLIALSAAVLLVAGTWLVWRARTIPPSPSEQIAAVPTASVTASPTLQPAPVASPPPAATPSRETVATVATFFLPPQSLRSAEEAPTLSMARQTQLVRLELQLMNSDAPSYSAVLLSDSSKPIREWKTVLPQRSPSGDTVVLRVPVSLLTESNYIVKLRYAAGSEPFTQQFRFTIARP